MKYLIDSNIIIYHLNGEELATAFLTDNKGECAISQITYIEVLSFAFTEDEERSVKAFLETFEILDIDKNIAMQAVKNRKLKKVKVPDNIIVSTAQVHGLILVTRNVDDFNALAADVLNIFATES